jgi:uncharacterized protein
MQWEGREGSENVEDRRGFRPTGMALGGGGIIVLLIAMFLGINPQQLGGLIGGGGGGEGKMERVEHKATPEEERQVAFSKVILRDTEIVWEDIFSRMGKRYEKPDMVIFAGLVQSACGRAEASVGPFYCPADRKVYLDVSFYRDMERKLQAGGDFARAYVIAHEVGHHVQHLLGYARRVEEVRRRGDPVAANHASVRLELQADFLAGVWAHHGQKKFNFLDDGDIDEALNAAFQIGDDRLQRKAQGTVVPDSFTHGTSKQRQRWFREGFSSGDVTRMKLLFELPYNQL